VRRSSHRIVMSRGRPLRMQGT